MRLDWAFLLFGSVLSEIPVMIVQYAVCPHGHTVRGVPTSAVLLGNEFLSYLMFWTDRPALHIPTCDVFLP